VIHEDLGADGGESDAERPDRLLLEIPRREHVAGGAAAGGVPEMCLEEGGSVVQQVRDAVPRALPDLNVPRCFYEGMVPDRA
jgi:hypothetical protein